MYVLPQTPGHIKATSSVVPLACLSNFHPVTLALRMSFGLWRVQFVRHQMYFGQAASGWDGWGDGQSKGNQEERKRNPQVILGGCPHRQCRPRNAGPGTLIASRAGHLRIGFSYGKAKDQYEWLCTTPTHPCILPAYAHAGFSKSWTYHGRACNVEYGVTRFSTLLQ
jgi:hypothetical protein